MFGFSQINLFSFSKLFLKDVNWQTPNNAFNKKVEEFAEEPIIIVEDENSKKDEEGVFLIEFVFKKIILQTFFSEIYFLKIKF